MACVCMVFGHAVALAGDEGYVYQHALEDFLQPMDDYAIERIHPPEIIMIHFTSAVVDHPGDPFRLENIRRIFEQNRISINYLIERDGTVRCWLPENRMARHAGLGSFRDIHKYTNHMNYYSIGIELLAIGSQQDMKKYLTAEQYDRLDDSFKGYTQAQYASLKALVEDLCSRYQIPADREHVIGHQEYSPQKNDPGELFDWSRILELPPEETNGENPDEKANLS